MVTNLREEIKKKDNEIHKMELELIQVFFLLNCNL